MRYQKRLSMPKTWPLAKKLGGKYLISAIGKKKEESLALLIIIRDLLKLALTKKEVKKILENKEILINGRIVLEEKFPVGLLDIISLPKLNKYYQLILEKNKLKLKEISEKDSNGKIYKVIGKKQITKKNIQINLYGGKNLIYDGKISVNDSILIDFKQNKIMKIIPFKENAKALVLFGKHAGKSGEIVKILRGGKIQEVVLKTKNEEIKIPIKNIFVTE